MPQFIITSPQGQKFKVTAPDGASHEDILAYAQKNMPQLANGPDFSEAEPAQENPEVTTRAAQAANPMNGQGSAADSAINGLTLGFGDEAAGAIGGALDWMGFGPEGSKGTFQGGYDRVTGNIRGKVQDYRARHPIAATAAEIAGSLPTLAIPGGAALKATSLPAKVVASSVGGGITGGLQGFSEGEGGLSNRLQAAGEGATIGAGLGALVPVAGRAVAKVVGSRAGRAAVPTNEALKTESQNLYKAANAQGLIVRNQSFRNLIGDITTDIKASGFHPKINRQTDAVLQTLAQEAKRTPTLEEIDQVRQIVGQVARGADPNERRLGGKIIEKIDDWLNNLTPNDVWAGDARQAVGTIRQARSLWARQAKGRVIENAISDAQQAASGFENGLRNEFRKLLKSNKRLGWTPDERKAIGRVVRGSAGNNLLRFLGTFGYSVDQARNWLGAVAGSGLGASALGPVGAVAVPAIGTAAKAAARAGTRRAAEKASAIVRNAGARPFDQAAANRAQTLTDLYLGTGARAAVPYAKEPLKLYIGAPTPGYK
jgi:hypothetical protein